jgi:3-phenylpropionate/trans-cinnamate dioxygenase ferredoxin reductase subunit
MAEKSCVIIGASHAGVSLALQLRKEGWTGAIRLIGAEPELPYHRPPLSKDFLSGAKTLDGIALRPRKSFEDNAIELLLGHEAVAINPAARSVQLQDGSEMPYSQLALCTGSRVRRLPEAERFANVFYIRTAADVARLSAQLAPGKRALIIGAGYIGLEAAAVLVKQQLDVTVLEMADRILQRVTGPILSAYLEAVHTAAGVHLHTATGIKAIEGGTNAEYVICTDGNRHAVDLLIIGIGIEPETRLAAAAGLEVEQGIVVDSHARTSDPCIFAAGDCTRHPSLLYGISLRLESVQNATDQARVAAANMAGKAIQYDAVPWFWSDQYTVKLQTAGIHSGYDNVVVRGDATDPASAGFALFYRLGERLLAVDCVNRPKEFMVSKQLLKLGAQPVAASLRDESQEPASWLQTF